MAKLPQFSLSFFHPRYWLSWAGIAVLWSTTQLPYPLLFKIGHHLGRFAMRLLPRRAHIARRNLALCFPQMSEEEREMLLVRNFESVGMGVIETGMAWFWPEWRVRIFGMLNPGIGVYRPNNNLLLDWLQTRGRLLSNKAMLDRYDLK